MRLRQEYDNVLLEFEAARVQLHTEYSQRLFEADKTLRELAVEREAFRETGAAHQNDIVTLNVGGQLHTVKRATLRVCPSSFLAELFSGRWEHALQKDAAGNVFLDVDPAVFELLLNWRARSAPARCARAEASR